MWKTVLIGLTILMMTMPGAAQDLMVGAAKKKITPSKTAYLAGYGANRPNTGGVHDDVWVRAMVVQSGGQKFAMAVCDLIGVFRADVLAIRERVKSVPANNVIVASTHVHSGPDTLGLWGPPGKTGRDPEYMEFLIKTVAECIDEAAAALQPAQVAFSAVQVENCSYNYRVKEMLDTEASVMQFKSKNSGKIILTVVNFACHPEVLNNDQMTSDFPNWVYQTIEAKTGGMALFANGALGGMVSPPPVPNEPEELKRKNWKEAERIGTTIAEKALESLQGAAFLDSAPIEHKMSPFEVPMENETFQAAAQAGILPTSALTVVNGNIVTEVHVIRFGPAVIATMPGEVLPNIGLTLKRSILKGLGEPKFLIGLGNDELGYILTEADHWLDLYRYERSMSVGSQIGDRMKDAIRTLANQMRPAVAAAPASGADETEKQLKAYVAKFRPDRAGKLKASYRFELSGEGGGVWYLKIEDGKAELSKEGDPQKVEVTILTPAKTFLDIISGKRDAIGAYNSGELQIKGEVATAQYLLYVFE